jgi:hypothetical protein
MRKIIILLILFPVFVMGQIAFPSAKGFGRNATGGRGGIVVKVTNLNNTGTGSLRNAIATSGAKTIVFTIGGTITLTSPIDINIPNITIAGETASGDGILIRGGTLIVSTSNVIIRHLRLRGGSSGDDALRIRNDSGISNIIVDHCSISWGSDEGLSVSSGTSVTIQNSILSENSKGFLIQRGQDVSVLNNILAFNSERNLEANSQTHANLGFEYINNYVYNFNFAFGWGMGVRGTVENNIFDASASFNPVADAPIDWTASNPANGAQGADSNTYTYLSGNIVDAAFPQGLYYTSGLGVAYIEGTPLYRSDYTPLTTTGLKANLLTTAGAYPDRRDAVDTRIISSINSDSGVPASSGTYPTIASGTAYTDADGDGMEDSYETTNFGSLATTNNTDTDGDGYTNLEEFLHFKAGEVITVVPDPLPEAQRYRMRIGTNIFPFFYLGSIKIYN